MKAIILAAGLGKRMRSNIPKVLHTVAGKPMIHCVIDTCLKAGIRDITVVVGKGGEEVQSSVSQEIKQPINFVFQQQQLGTGHAVLCAKEHISPKDKIVVLCGDTPLIKPELLQGLLMYQESSDAHGIVVATKVPDPKGYGRVISEIVDRPPTYATGGYEIPGNSMISNGCVKISDSIKITDFVNIVEQRDLEADQDYIDIINTGVYMFTGREFIHGLERIDNKNNQGEYYLTDVPKILKEAGHRVKVYNEPDHLQFLGVNTQKQLSEASAVLRSRIIDYHFEKGVMIIDPSNTYIDENVVIEPGVILHPGVILQGASRIGALAEIGPHTRIKDSQIGPGTVVQTSVIEGAEIGSDCQIGPFAYLRTGTKSGDRCRIGDFVEVKNATLGNDTKASHLAYIGDAQIGNGVNIGCGAITVNYDGVSKHKTIVEDEAFIGSNVNLIAPVTVRSGAIVAAGSTVDKEVPEDAMAIARQKQTNREGAAKKYRDYKKSKS